MMAWIAVAAGGALGAVARYGISRAVAGCWPQLAFPLAIMGINWLGCLLMGVWVACVAQKPALAAWHPLLAIGVLGGFTTFSSFGLEFVQLWQRGQTEAALAYVLLSVAGGCAAVLAGMLLTRYALSFIG